MQKLPKMHQTQTLPKIHQMQNLSKIHQMQWQAIDKLIKVESGFDSSSQTKSRKLF